MVPVVGGFLSGIVLCIVSYDSKGIPGVAVFLGVAFFLGKVESYYLAPRLTAWAASSRKRVRISVR